MAEKAKEYLIETSVVPAAVGASTTAHIQHYADVVRDGRLLTSTYIRKEFLLAFFCELVYAAFFIGQRTSVRDSLILLAQRYSPRKIKVDMTAIAILLEERKAMHSPNVAAEELGSLAIKWLKSFDRVFRDKIPNEVGCRIGDKRPSIDYNTMLKDLYAFYEDFTDPVDDCPVNDFLGVGSPNGRGQALITEKKVQKIDSVKELAKLLADGGRFVCDDCRKIGDAVIALEQPANVCLVHIDHAYTKFCSFLRREHKPIKSAIAIDNEGMEAPDKHNRVG